MGLIQANLPQHLVPLLVHECDACLSLTELMLLLLWMRMLFSFSLFVFRRLNPRDFASTVGHYCCHWCIASSVHLFCMLIIKVLHYCVVGENIPLSNLEIRSKAKVFFFFFLDECVQQLGQLWKPYIDILHYLNWVVFVCFLKMNYGELAGHKDDLVSLSGDYRWF